MPSAGGPSPSISQYVSDVQTNLTNTLLSKADAATTYATKGEVAALEAKQQTAFASLITFNTLAGPQTAANLFVGLSPNSRLTIPRGSLTIGDMYRLQFSALVNASTLGNSASFDLSTTAAGAITQFPIVASVTTFTDTPVIARTDITVASATTINTNTAIGGFVFGGGGPVLLGFSFATAGVPFDINVDQTFEFTYTSPDFTSMQMTEIIFYRVASGSA